MAHELKEAFAGFPRDLLNGIRNNNARALDDVATEAAIDEFSKGVDRATAAMIEAGVEKDTIVRLLQKHWDMRLSEAQGVVAHFSAPEE